MRACSIHFHELNETKTQISQNFGRFFRPPKKSGKIQNKPLKNFELKILQQINAQNLTK
jgi:hypothetical protein